MNSKNVYIIQIISVLIILLCIMICILFEKSQPIDYGFGKIISIQENYDSKKEYYLYNEKSLESYKEHSFDENGIILINKSNELLYQPSLIAHYGLILYSEYIKTQNVEYLEKAKKQADYLLDIQDKENGNLYFDYNFEVDGIEQVLEKKWVSASAQGKALSLFSRIYFIENDERYKIGCELAIKSFSRSVEEDGVCAKFFGYDFYEEYPTKIPNYTLLGHMESLLGLYDFCNIIGNEEAQKLYKNGIETLEISLPYYDSDRISLRNLAHIKYDKISKIYGEGHHRNNSALLNTINQLESSEIINYFSDKWEGYLVKDN